MDGYYQHMQALAEANAKKGMKKKKGKHGRKRSVVINKARLNLEPRYLPPCQMVDVYDQMRASESHALKPVSFACFWRTWCSEFPHLHIRSSSSHSMCAECSQYKSLLRDLAHHLRARAAQESLYLAHLASQYADRLQYWSLRAQSRLKPTNQVCIMIDSIDQMKFSYPRGEIYRSKSLCTMNKPKAHCTGLLCHGHFLMMATAEHCVRKDGSAMCELLSHALTKLQQDFKINLASTTIHIQSDNTSRETKNIVFCKWASRLVSHSTLDLFDPE